MEHWLGGTRAFVTPAVLEDPTRTRRILRDADGDWQLFDTVEGDPREAHLLHLFHVLDADRSLLDVLDLEDGEAAERRAPGKAWRRGRMG